MKYFPLIWATLWRKKTRTIFTLLSVIVAFLLFGMLETVDYAFAHPSGGITGADKLITTNKVSITLSLPFADTQQIRSVLLHWNGKGWHVYRSPVNQLSGIASDGHGGVWMTADPVIPGRAILVHYAYGRWAAEVPAPQPDGQPTDDVTLSGIVRIPGTTSLWAVGSVHQPETTPDGMIEAYAP